ncbi:MAG: hypothetical protein O2930_12305 [Acidobacteria bacterium]|nr:hypothetical protein [Acidobacteriota bacterium]
MLPTSVLREAGALDEEFGWGYCEDDDYCHRLRRAGYRLSLCPGSVVIHEGAHTMHRVHSPDLIPRNLARFQKKWGEAVQGMGQTPPPAHVESPMLWSLPVIPHGSIEDEETGAAPVPGGPAGRVPLGYLIAPPIATTSLWSREQAPRPLRLGVSLLVQADADVVEDQIWNLRHFLDDPVIVLHVNRERAAPFAQALQRRKVHQTLQFPHIVLVAGLRDEDRPIRQQQGTPKHLRGL